MCVGGGEGAEGRGAGVTWCGVSVIKVERTLVRSKSDSFYYTLVTPIKWFVKPNIFSLAVKRPCVKSYCVLKKASFNTIYAKMLALGLVLAIFGLVRTCSPHNNTFH